DAKKKKKKNKCVQGVVLLNDCTPESGGLIVIPKSHLYHEEVCNRIKYPGGDFVPLPRNDPLFDTLPDGGVLVQCKAGDLCLWDSRTVHANQCSTLPDINPITNQPWEMPKEGWDLIRVAYYVCMTPRYKATNSILRKRLKSFALHITSTHWPHYFAHRLGTGYVQHDPNFTLNEYQQSLVGRPRHWWEELHWQIYYQYEVDIPSAFVKCLWMGTFAAIVAKAIRPNPSH
ncbi:hypothetical protein RFI_09672, partial [Reticulomyxa filosa]